MHTGERVNETRVLVFVVANRRQIAFPHLDALIIAARHYHAFALVLVLFLLNLRSEKFYNTMLLNTLFALFVIYILDLFDHNYYYFTRFKMIKTLSYER